MLLTMARLTAAALLIASAAAFAAGTTIERHTASSRSQAAQQEQRHHPETGAAGDNSAGVEGAANGESSSTHAAEHSSETLLGINPEATWLVGIAIAVSLVLAALILTRRSPWLAVGVALIMLVFTALDIREVTHQLNESHAGLVALAAAAALLHLAAGAAALLTTRRARSQPSANAA